MIRDFIEGKKKALSGEDNSVGIGGFKLFARVSEGVNYKATVPNQFLEDGSNAADDILLDPITIIIRGVVGDQHIELSEPPERVQALQDATGKISALLPNRTQSQINKIKSIGTTVMNAVDTVDKYLDAGAAAYDLVSGADTPKPLREKFIDFIEAVYFGKQLIDVDVEFRTHTNMAIVSLDLRTDNKTKETAFEIQLQKVQIASAEYTDIGDFYKKPAAGSADTVAGKTDEGAQNPKAGQEKSLLSAMLGR